MSSLISNKFMDFLTSKIANTPIPIWAALAAISLMIICIAVIIIASTNKKNKNKSGKKTIENIEPVINSDINNVATESAPIIPTEYEEEIAFEETYEPFIEPDEYAIVDKREETIAAEPIAPIQVAPITAVEPPRTIAESITDTINTESIQAPSAKVITDSVEEPITAKVITASETITPNKPVNLPQYGLDTDIPRPIAKPMAKPIAKPISKQENVKPIAAPIKNQESVKSIARPIATKAPAEVANDTASKTSATKAVKQAPKITAVTKPEPTKTIATKVATIMPTTPKPIVQAVTETKVVPDVKVVTEVKNDEESGNTFGKYVITINRNNPERPYAFTLIANNGQLLFESEPYKQKPRETAMAAFKKYVKEGEFVIDADKTGTFRYKLYNNKHQIIGVGETYKSRSSCEKSIESVKRFSESATVVEDQTKE